MMKISNGRLMLFFGAVLFLSVCTEYGTENLLYAAPNSETPEVSGKKPMQFRVLHTRDHLPDEAQKVLKDAHGGFAVDRREGKGQVYFALPGAGIMRISSDFASVKLLDTPAAMKKANLHNTTIWYEGGKAYLTFPSNNRGKVFTTDLDGNLVHTLEAPSSDETFQNKKVNKYFREGGEFVPTDVEYQAGFFYITTGYSDLDYVLTGSFEHDGNENVSIEWHSLAFGGKGDGPGQFGTGHGITENEQHLHISDRPHSEIDKFDLKGAYLSTLNLPKGSWPCDVDFEKPYAVVGCLHGPDRDRGAPIYILRDQTVISTVMIKEDLGLNRFQHMHNAVMRKVDGKFYLIAQSWNPGDFVILEQVTSKRKK